MDKELCDRIICEYNKKLYGFALTKTGSIERAEELAARITLEVYSSLLKRENIANINAYVYRIAQNVWARFTDEYRNSPYCGLDDFDIEDSDDFTERVAESETYAKLRLEIAYLSKLRREILVRHYYKSMKLSDIAKELDIPLGTVKWHLSGAKSTLKEGMKTMRSIGKLGIDPISFSELGHDGRPGSKGDTADFFSRRLTQNIAWAAYHKPLTINEIADEIGVSPIFVADEVEVLEEYGFMDRLGDKYLTNMYITDPTKELCEAEHELNVAYAKKICEVYIPKVVEALMDFDRSKLYIPDGDENLWLWSGIMFAASYQLNLCEQDDALDEYRVRRKDGGNYVAFACVNRSFDVSFDGRKYGACGSMTRGSDKYPIFSWQVTTCYDTREMGWRENLWTDYEYLYEFYTGALKKEPSQIEHYKRLRDKGYLTADDEVNLICVNHEGAKWLGETPFSRSLPQANDEIRALLGELSDKLYKLREPHFPEHIRPLAKLYARPNLRMYIIEQLVGSGVLKLPSQKRAAGLNTLLFVDRLPNK